jgi:hypothetical protein
MTTYTGIQGQNILITATDPANPTEGQIWYNTTSNTLKGYQYVATNTWASGGNLNRTGYYMSTTGTQTAALGFGRSSSATELYNGTAWTDSPATMNETRYHMGAGGTQTATIGFGGGNETATKASESFNGTSWTSTNPLVNFRSYSQGFGLQTAAICIQGATNIPYASYLTNITESWNGTSWTNVPGGNTTAPSTSNSQCCGTQTAGIIAGGNDSYPGPAGGTTQLWNGSVWTNSPSSLNTARALAGAFGTQTAAVVATGTNGPAFPTATELWNGSTWTSNPTGVSTGRQGTGSAGTQSLGIISGGYGTPGASSLTEKWTGTQLVVRTITVS